MYETVVTRIHLSVMLAAVDAAERACGPFLMVFGELALSRVGLDEK